MLTAFLAVPPPEARKPILLYEDSIDESGLQALSKADSERYLIVYQHLADPAAESGKIDKASLLKHLGNRLNVDSQGWGVLDFENPYDAILQQGPASDRWEATTRTMIDALRAAKAMFPKMKWTFYGVPGLAYYLKNNNQTYTWDTAPKELAEQEVARQIACYGPVIAECDWLAPCVYSTVGNPRFLGGQSPQTQAATRAYVSARVGMCVRVSQARKDRPKVIPFASPLYQYGGGARCLSRIPRSEILRTCVEPAVDAGADGLAIWTGAHYFIDAVTKPGPSADFADCGGRQAVATTWSEDLGITTEELLSPAGYLLVRRMFSAAQVDMVQTAQDTWAHKRPTQSP
jgi:hypothetical protein